MTAPARPRSLVRLVCALALLAVWLPTPLPVKGTAE